MEIKNFMKMIDMGADFVIGAESELTDIDSKFGDADHGITMSKVMKNVKNVVATQKDDATFKSFLDDVSMGVMSINGGSAVPLWSTLFEGMSEGAPASEKVDMEGFKNIFKTGYETLAVISKAKVGDKTMMDTLIPAVEGICTSTGSIKDAIFNGKEEAIKGAKASENFISKFGRAKSYKEKTIGTPDAGAMSMMYFFIGMNEAVN